jgi:hypothetical protein
MYKRRNESQWICCEMYKGEESSSEDVGWFHSKSIHTKKSYFPIYFFFCNSENEVRSKKFITLSVANLHIHSVTKTIIWCVNQVYV